MNIVSFYAPRPEHPRFGFCDYIALLRVLQRSCDRLGLRHVVLTDDDSLPFESFCRRLPGPLMQAVTTAQALWLTEGDWRGQDTLLVGADCLLLQDPRPHLAGRCDVGVTYRGPYASHPINTGMIYVAVARRLPARLLFNTVASTCGTTWCDDQRAIKAALSPLPSRHGNQRCLGLDIGFLPMEPFNRRPERLDDPMEGSVLLHFRGKADRKQMMLDWAERWLP